MKGGGRERERQSKRSSLGARTRACDQARTLPKQGSVATVATLPCLSLCPIRITPGILKHGIYRAGLVRLSVEEINVCDFVAVGVAAKPNRRDIASGKDDVGACGAGHFESVIWGWWREAMAEHFVVATARGLSQCARLYK